MADAVRDNNNVPSLLGVSSSDLVTPTRIAANPTTKALLIDSTSLYSGLDTRYLKLDTSNDPLTGDLLFSGSQKIIGGTSTTADLTLQTTSGVGTTGADMHFLVGNNGATEAMTILNSGSVGIGTTAPGAKLMIDGSADDEQLIVQAHSTQTANILEIQNSSATPLVVVSGAGTVGIGTTAPVGILHLYKAAAASRLAIDGDAGQNRLISYRTGALQRFGLYVNNTAESGSNAGSNFAIRAYSDAGTLLSTPFFINRATGNVGIGTTSPQGSLQITKQAGQTSPLLRLDSGSANYYTDFTSDAAEVLFKVAINGVSLIQSGNYYFGDRLSLLPAGGNVGIGTTAPTGKLHIYSNVNTTLSNLVENPNTGGSAYAQFRIQTIGSSNALLVGIAGTGVSGTGLYGGNRGYVGSEGSVAGVDFYAAAGNMRFFTGGVGAGNERMQVTSTGNVGIGTTSPTAKLFVSDISSSTPSLTAGAAATVITNAASIELAEGSHSSSPYAYWMQSRTGGVAWPLSLNPLGGNVGIGTTAPAGKLEVLGASAAIFTRAVDGAGAPDSAIQIGLSETTATVGGGPSFLFFGNNSAGTKSFTGRMSSVWENVTAGSEAAGITFSTRANTGDTTASTERMRITSAGNVGIGTSSPAAGLQVANGNVRLTNGASFITANSLIREINSASGSVNQFVTSAIGFNTGDFSDAGVLTFSTANNASTPTERMRITQTGNVGIGTTAPTNLLSLGGNSARIFWMERHTTANTAGNTLTITAGGATSGATNKAGGNLILQGGLSTGSAESGVILQGVVAGASGTSDRTQTTEIQVLGNKIGLFGVTPVIQPAAANQAALTNSTTGSYDGTLADVGVVFSQAVINNNFTDVYTLLTEIRTALVNVGIIKGSA